VASENDLKYGHPASPEFRGKRRQALSEGEYVVAEEDRKLAKRLQRATDSAFADFHDDTRMTNITVESYIPKCSWNGDGTNAKTWTPRWRGQPQHTDHGAEDFTPLKIPTVVSTVADSDVVDIGTGALSVSDVACCNEGGWG